MSQEAIAQDLVAQGNEVLFAFRRALGAFAQHLDDSRTSSPVEAACKAELQRFQLWAINLGLFQASHNSLEYRLRQNATVRSLIATLLTDLCLALDDLVDESFRDIKDQKDDTKQLDAESHSGVQASLDAPSLLFVNKSEVSDCSTGQADEEDLMTMYTDDVIEINDELMKVAMQIRSLNSREPRHKTYPSGKTDHDEQDVFKGVLMSFRKKGIEQTMISARLRRLSVDQAAATPVLRGSDEFLVDRLSKANDFRRQQFEYWRRYRSHSVRATTHTAVAADADDPHDKVQPRAALNPTADVAFGRLDHEAPKTVSMPSVSLLAPDFKLRSVPSARTHQSRALTIHTPSGDLIAWPEVPSSVPIGKEFECPLCFFICPQEQRSGEPWRVHLKHDLCPYLCTFPNCSQPDTLYESRDQWIQHEQWNHMCFWRCPKDDIEFESLSAYEAHIITQHPGATAAGNKLLSDGVLETQRFMTEQPSRSCPFCDVDLEGVEEIYDHIGAHLETVAMLAIPTLDDRDLQSNPDAASSEAAGRDVDGSRKNDFEKALPVLFPENDHPDHQPPAEQQMSGSNFERLLAGLPRQEVLDTSAWAITVNPSDNATSEPSGDTIRNDSQTIKEDLSIQQKQRRLQHRTVTTWISPIDLAELQAKIIGTRQQGTGVWFTDSTMFLDWLYGPNQTLFCPGEHATGKTVIAAIVVDYLWKYIQAEGIGVAYFYCDFQKRADQSFVMIAATILRQLVQQHSSIPSTVAALYDLYAALESRPPSGEIFRALQVVVADYTQIYLVIDGLDKCPKNIGFHLLSLCRQLQSTGRVRLMVTSRPESEILQHFKAAPTLEIRAESSDLSPYVADQISRLPPHELLSDELRQEIVRRISTLTGGLFIHVRLLVESLRLLLQSPDHKFTKEQILSTVDAGGQSLHEAYSNVMVGIESQSTEHRKLAKSVLSWMLYAQHPLSTGELCHAVAVEPGDCQLDPEKIPDVDKIVSVCAGLVVVVDNESRSVRLYHQSTLDYLQSIRESWMPGAREQIASVCLAYMSFDTFASGACGSHRDLAKRMGQNPFYPYAALNWAAHSFPIQEAISHLAIPFLQHRALVASASQVLSYDDEFLERSTGLHLTARFGLSFLTEELLRVAGGAASEFVDSKDADGSTPLALAVAEGHVGVVKLLLARNDVDANRESDRGRSPLSLAVERGYERVVKLLLERKDIHADAKDFYGYTPLTYAVLYNHEMVVKLLLARNDIDANREIILGRSALSVAAENGHETVVKMLLARVDVNIEAKDYKGQTALSLATGRGHETVVKLLLERKTLDIKGKG